MRGCRTRQCSSNQESGARRMKTLLGPRRLLGAAKARMRLCCMTTHGSVAAEFALTAPTVILLASAIVDFGMLATKSIALTAATRVGAEYARAHPDDASGTRHAIQNAISFAPALTFPASFPRSCEWTRRRSRAANHVPPSAARRPIAYSFGLRGASLLLRSCRGRAFPQ